MPRFPLLLVFLLALCTIARPVFGQSAGSEAGDLPAAAASATADAAGIAAADRRIEQSIAARLDRIDTLSGVSVESTAGVVTLRGEVIEEADAALAAKVAQSVPAVVDVRNSLTTSAQLRLRLEPMLDRAVSRVQRLVSSTPLLLVALLVVWLSNLIGRRLASADLLFRRVARDNSFLRDVLRQVVRLLALVIGLLIALDLLDATAMVGALLGTAGVVGLAIGFAFKDLVENYIASILLSVRQPFAPNDHVLISGEEGKVVSLTPRATVLLGMDGTLRMLPNATVFKSVIVNFSRNPQRRFEFELGVRPGQPLAQVQARLLDTLNGIDGVLFDPAPVAVVEEYGDSRVALRLRAWVDQRTHGIEKVRSQSIRLCAGALDAIGVAWPESTLRLLRNHAATPTQPITADAGQAADDTSVDTYLDKHATLQRQQLPGDDLLHEEPPPHAVPAATDRT